jgi:hypothetical protein
MWRWPGFSPAEIACRGAGAIKINTEAMAKLHSLRNRLGEPLIVRSGYRSPSHNRAVGGPQPQSTFWARRLTSPCRTTIRHLCRGRPSGRLPRFVCYLRSGFMHIDLGPARSCGEPVPARATPFVPEVAPAHEALADSRTLKGGRAVGIGTVGAAGVEVAQDVLAEAQSAILPLVPYFEALRLVFIAVALMGIAIAIHARIDDWKRSQR